MEWTIMALLKIREAQAGHCRIAGLYALGPDPHLFKEDDRS